MKGFHHLNDDDVLAGVDELMVGLGGVSPAPGISEGVKLRLAYFAAGLAKEDVVIGVGIKRRIEINEIDAGIGKFFPVPQPTQVIAEIQPVHSTARDSSTSLGMTTGCSVTLLAEVKPVHSITIDSHSTAFRASSRLRSD